MPPVVDNATAQIVDEPPCAAVIAIGARRREDDKGRPLKMLTKQEVAGHDRRVTNVVDDQCPWFPQVLDEAIQKPGVAKIAREDGVVAALDRGLGVRPFAY